MGSACGGTSQPKTFVSEPQAGPQPTGRCQGPQERSTPPRNIDTSPRNFLDMSRRDDAGEQPMNDIKPGTLRNCIFPLFCFSSLYTGSKQINCNFSCLRVLYWKFCLPSPTAAAAALAAVKKLQLYGGCFCCSCLSWFTERRDADWWACCI